MDSIQKSINRHNNKLKKIRQVHRNVYYAGHSMWRVLNFRESFYLNYLHTVNVNTPFTDYIRLVRRYGSKKKQRHYSIRAISPNIRTRNLILRIRNIVGKLS